MKKILVYIWRAWFVILGSLLTILFFLPVYILSFRKEHYKYAYFFVRLWCFGLFYGMGFRYSLTNLTDKKVDKNLQYVLISNHSSIIDVMLPCILLPNHPLCFVGKKEIEKIPIFGSIYRRICVLVDRKSPKSRAQVYTRCAERMEEGDSIVLFPEGGVSEDTSIILDEFKDGAFVLAATHQKPILIYTFVGLKEMFPFNNSKGYPGRVKVFFNDILEPNETSKELKAKAFEEIKFTLENNLL